MKSLASEPGLRKYYTVLKFTGTCGKLLVSYTVKFQKQAPGLIFEGAYIPRGLSTEGNLRFKID